MPSLGRPGLPRYLAFALASLVGLVCGLGFWFSLPDPREGRELALALAAQAAPSVPAADTSLTASDDVSAAQALCMATADTDLESADCRLGRPLGLPGAKAESGAKAATQHAAVARAQQRLGVKIAQYAAIRDALLPVLQGSDRSWLVGY